MKRILSKLISTPLHPQWLIFLYENKKFKDIAEQSSGKVLDIGCAGQKLRRYLPASCSYIGLDYPDTANILYNTRPDTYGDAQQLPFADNTFDTISFLEVLEHLPNHKIAVNECYRVLKSDGNLFFSMPFLYPIHDAPFDFQRLTIHGLRKLFTESGFIITEEKSIGNPVTTASILNNIALVKTTLNAFSTKHPAIIMIFSLPILIPLFNIVGYIYNIYGPADSFMALGYTLRLRKIQPL